MFMRCGQSCCCVMWYMFMRCGCAFLHAGAPKDPRQCRGPIFGPNPRAAPYGRNRCGGLACFVPTSPRVSAPLAQCAREAAPFSLTLGTAELRRPPPRPPLKRSSYAGSYGWRWWCSRWLRSFVLRGCSPAPPLGWPATPPGGARWLHDPPGVRRRGPPGPFRRRPGHPPCLTLGVG